MNLSKSYWKLLVFYVVLLSVIVVLNYLRTNTDIVFADYFIQQLPKLFMIALVGTTFQFILSKQLKKTSNNLDATKT